MTTVEVTEKHIAEGERHHCRRCPYALAIASVCTEGTHLDVGATTAAFARGSLCKSVRMPTSSAVNIAAFDRTGVMHPHSFDLDVPAWALREVAK